MEERARWGGERLSGERRELARALGSLVGWKGPEFLRFLKYWGGDPRRWWESEDPLRGACGSTKKIVRDLRELHQEGRESTLVKVRSWPGETMLFGEKGYPEGLLTMKSSPAVIHLQGNRDALRRPGLAVVGSRKIGVRTAKAASTILRGLVRTGVVLISGGALGADGVAHEASVRAGKPTVAVLPSGLGRWTPRSHEKLFETILEAGGALISEYAPFETVRKYHFRRRNELIAALSEAVFVLRAAEESGTMLTVKAAGTLGRALAAMPGEPDDPLSVGCHRIIQEGGELIASSEDLLRWWRGLGPWEERLEEREEKEIRQGSLVPECPVLSEARGLREGDGGVSLEALIRATGRSAGEIQALLLEYELAGLVERLDSGERFRLTW